MSQDNNYHDAYLGAMERALLAERRLHAAEEELAFLRPACDGMSRELAEIFNGKVFMGEPVLPKREGPSQYMQDVEEIGNTAATYKMVLDTCIEVATCDNLPYGDIPGYIKHLQKGIGVLQKTLKTEQGYVRKLLEIRTKYPKDQQADKGVGNG